MSVLGWVLVAALAWLLIGVIVVGVLWEQRPTEEPEVIEEIDERELALAVRQFRRELRDLKPEDFEEETHV